MKPTHITIHCSATAPHLDIGGTDINRWHSKRFGTLYRCSITGKDIGYAWVIRRNGIIDKGRSELSIGIHTKGHNSANVGVCLVGGVDKEGQPEFNYTPMQMTALKVLLGEIQHRHNIPDGNIKGHRDWYGDRNKDGVIDRRDWLKDCPCFDVAEWLGK